MLNLKISWEGSHISGKPLSLNLYQSNALIFSSREAMGKGEKYGHWVLVENDAHEKSND